MSKLNVLITHPEFQDPGGVMAFVRKIKPALQAQLTHFIIGSREESKNPLRAFQRLFKDYWRFYDLVKSEKFDIVHINPSLNIKSFLRDGIFIIIAKNCKKKVVVYFHGWRKSFENKISTRAKLIFRFLYGRADCFIVLASEFKNALIEWGINNPVYVEKMVIEDEFYFQIDLEKYLQKRLESNSWKILFLSRIIKEKGIYECLQIYSLVKAQIPEFQLYIVGDGPELENVRHFVEKNRISGVTFTGYLTGKEKTNMLEEAHLLVFPSYSEGFPNALVESMAYGLPLVVHSTGGIHDFFNNGNHGYAFNHIEANQYSQKIIDLYRNIEVYRRIAIYNHKYVKEYLLASSTAKHIDSIYKDL